MEQKNTTPRRRKRSRYPARLSLQVTPAMKRALEDMADRLELDVAEIGRRAIEAGLPGLAPEGAEPDAPRDEDIRLWWEGLSFRQRTGWGKKLRHIRDETAFRAEAFRQAREGRR